MRGHKILDLFFTTNPTLVDNVSISPGLSDHDIVLAQVSLKTRTNETGPTRYPFIQKSRLGSSQSMRNLHLEFLESDLATTDVQTLWDMFVTRLKQGINKTSPLGKLVLVMDFPG